MDLPRSKVGIANIQQEIPTKPDPFADCSLILEAPRTEVDQIVNSPLVHMIETRESHVSPFIPSDLLKEGISQSGEHQLVRRKQDLYSEGVTVLGKRTREDMTIGEKNTDIAIWYDSTGEDAEADEEVCEEKMDVNEQEMDELKLFEFPCKAPERTKIIKNTQPVDALGVAVISCPSVNNHETQEDEETTVDANSLHLPIQELEDWSTTLRSLIKGKKRFQHQVRYYDPYPLPKFLIFAFWSGPGFDKP